MILRRRLTLAQNDPAERLKMVAQLQIPKAMLKKNSFKNKLQAKRDPKGGKRNALQSVAKSLVQRNTTTPALRKATKPEHSKSSRNPESPLKRNSAEMFPFNQPETISENDVLESHDDCGDLGAFSEVSSVNGELWLPGNRYYFLRQSIL